MPEKIATNLQSQANRIFQKLSPILQKYGKVTKGGSFNLNLMAWPDIDLYLDIGRKKPLDTAFAIAKEGILLPKFFSTKIERDMTKRLDFVPHGTYVQFQKRNASSPHWKIDLWILPTKKIEKLKYQAEQLKKLITPTKRKLILQMKQSLITEKGRTPTQSGYYLMQAILVKEMKDKTKILNFLKQSSVKI